MPKHSFHPPEVGDIIKHDYAAWRILDVRDVDRENRQFDLEMEKLTNVDPDGDNRFVATSRKRARFDYLPEHFPVCNKCGEVPPCREEHSKAVAEREMQQLSQAMKVPDGACPACSEPITTRQQFYEFPGPNLLNPLGAPDVRFHRRMKCRSAAVRYEHKWVKAEPGRERSLLTLSCKGKVSVHADGTAQCDRGPLCPHIYARHFSMSACYFDGCDECDPSNGHPGTRLAKDLQPDGTRRALL